MGHSHSGFASTKLKPPNNTTPIPVNQPVVVTLPPNDYNDVVSTSTSNVMIYASAPLSPSSTQTNTTPYYQQLEYNPQEQSLKNNNNDKNEALNPYINGYVSPYYANIHQNVDIKQCTTRAPKVIKQYRRRCDSNCNTNIASFSDLARAKIPLKNKVSKISSLYKYIKQLGTGASSRVLLVENITTNQKYAMKELLINNENNHRLFLLEIKILNILKNSVGIVEIYDIYMDDTSYYIVMEYCSAGSLLNKIISSHHFSEQHGRKYIKCILSAVDIMHDKNIAHKDIKPNNMVFAAGDHESLKIIDFGQSEIIENNEKIYAFKQVGTTSFVPPEFHRSRSGLELKKGDSWSIGCVCFLIMAGKTLFGGNNSTEIWKKICVFNDKYLQNAWPENINLSKECKDFIGKLLNPNVHKRLSIKQALAHKWIKSDIKSICDIKFEPQHKHNLTLIYTKNKLQKILADAIVEEMDEKEIKMLIDHVKNKNDVVEQLLLYHHNNYHSINLNKKDKMNNQELMHYRAHHIMNTLTEIKLNFKYNDLFDEYEYDEKDHDHDQDNGTENENENENEMKSVCVSEFKSIMKQSKKEYDVDKLIKDLDPNNSGFVAFEAISQFMKPVKTHTVLPGI